MRTLSAKDAKYGFCRLIDLARRENGSDAERNGRPLSRMDKGSLSERDITKVDQLMAHCDRLEAGLDAADGTRNRLLESLLQGTLTASSHEPVAAGAVEA